MEKRGVELLPKIKPAGWEKTLTLWAEKGAIPFIATIQILFLLLLVLQLPLRFSLTTLSASVKEHETLLEYKGEAETLYRTTQIKLAKIAEVHETLCHSCALRKVEALVPTGISITSLTIEGEKFTLSAETYHGPLFASFLSKIIEEEAVKTAAITSGSLNEEGLFTFTLELYLDKEKVK